MTRIAQWDRIFKFTTLAGTGIDVEYTNNMRLDLRMPPVDCEEGVDHGPLC